MYKLAYILAATSVIHASFTHADLKRLDHTIEKKSSFYIKGALGYALDFKKFKMDSDEADKEVITYTNGKVKSRNPLYSIAIGYKFNPLYTTDINYVRINAQYKGEQDGNGYPRWQKLQTNAWFMNVYRNFLLSQKFTPYVSAGAGASFISGNLLLNNKREGFSAPIASKARFIWNVGLGTKAKISERIELDLSYRYLYLGNIKTKPTQNNLEQPVSTISQKIRAHSISAGIIYNF